LQNATQPRIKQTIDDYFSEQDQHRMAVDAIQSRRSPLAQQPVTRPPFQLEIVRPTRTPPALNFPLTIQPESPIKAKTDSKGNP